jgi:hypothetical protein
MWCWLAFTSQIVASRLTKMDRSGCATCELIVT